MERKKVRVDKLSGNIVACNQIQVKVPQKYSEESDQISAEEENALFAYLTNEFFRQLSKLNILPKGIVSELSFLCESYFDFREITADELVEAESLYGDEDERYL